MTHAAYPLHVKPAMSEEFLELIENQHRREQIVVLAPEFQVAPMQVAPQGFASIEWGKISFVRGQFFPQPLGGLVERGVLGGLRNIEADVDRQVMRLS